MRDLSGMVLIIVGGVTGGLIFLSLRLLSCAISWLWNDYLEQTDRRWFGFGVITGALLTCVVLASGCSHHRKRESFDEYLLRLNQEQRNVIADGPERRLICPDPEWEDQR